MTSPIAPGWIESRGKFSDCVQNHACDSTRSEELPLRLLDLRADLDNAGRIRLVTGQEARTVSGTNVQYAALSYCWGAATPFVTTPSTLSSRMEGFHVSEMPLTLRDTVKVARGLQIRYLWIDALCILQGSRDDNEARADWQHEAARMHLIYGNSCLCIVAAGASRADQGLMFKVCLPLWHFPFARRLIDIYTEPGAF